MVPGLRHSAHLRSAKQALFNVLGASIQEPACSISSPAGTGSVGIEALSRGAQRAGLSSMIGWPVSTIQANIKTTGFDGRGRVLRADVFIHLRNDPGQGFDYIHVAPPQYHNLWAETLAALDARRPAGSTPMASSWPRSIRSEFSTSHAEKL